MRVIAHIDADCFYVSCERVRDPRLRGKPVAVLGNQGACVIARSYEIRPMGVTVGMPVWEAKKICPDGIYIKRDFQWYSVLSYAMQDVLKEFSDTVEYYSIDESFVDFGDYLGDLNELAVRMRGRMIERVGIPASVGISITRTLSKMAAKKNKPFGVTVLERGGLADFWKETCVKDVPGIGGRLYKRLSAVGVETVADFVGMSSVLARRILHKPGEELWYELRGRSVLPVRAIRPERKNIGRGGSLWGHHRDKNYVWGFLCRHLEKVADCLWRYEIEAGEVSVFLGTSEGGVYKAVKKLPDYSYSYSLLLESARDAFECAFRDGLSYCQSFLLVSDLRSVRQKQMSLFCAEGDSRMTDIKRKLNEKFGVFAVRSGATAFANAVCRDKTSDFEISDVEGKFCF